MSQITGTTSSTKRPFIDMVVDDMGLVDFFIAMPPVLAATLGEYNFDTVDHIRRSAIKRHGLHDRLGGQRMIASRFYRYGSRGGRVVPKSISEIRGEVFGVGQQGKDELGLLEEGGEVNAGEAMAIPMGRGLTQAGATRGQFRDWLRNRQLVPVMLRGRLFLARKTGQGKSRKLQFVARLSRRRFQRPLLGFFANANRVAGEKVAKYSRAIELAQTEAGRATLERALPSLTAYGTTFRAMLGRRKRKSAGGGNITEADARRLAKQAAARVRAELRAQRGGD
ncbi:MAG: hypothetical protein IT435_16070 [Phycisphaerales bacterium]|nr:hypothetical protein [Phycisphaerales bacterium]